jgi:hypothetical protein
MGPNFKAAVGHVHDGDKFHLLYMIPPIIISSK